MFSSLRHYVGILSEGYVLCSFNIRTALPIMGITMGFLGESNMEHLDGIGMG